MLVETLLALTVIVHSPPVDDTYHVRLRLVGEETIAECGIQAAFSKASDDIVTWYDVGNTTGWNDQEFNMFALEDRPGVPDLLIRGWCENEKGRTYSLEVACLDQNPADCVRQCGDINADFKISIVDFVLMRMAVSRGIDHEYCDVNDDAQCTLADFIWTRQHVAGKYTSELSQTCEGRN